MIGPDREGGDDFDTVWQGVKKRRINRITNRYKGGIRTMAQGQNFIARQRIVIFLRSDVIVFRSPFRDGVGQSAGDGKNRFHVCFSLMRMIFCGLCF